MEVTLSTVNLLFLFIGERHINPDYAVKCKGHTPVLLGMVWVSLLLLESFSLKHHLLESRDPVVFFELKVCGTASYRKKLENT